MGLLDDIKTRLQEVAEKVPDIRDEAVEKIRKAGEGSMQISQNLFGEISDKVSDIAALTRLRYNIKVLEEELVNEHLKLGKIGFIMLQDTVQQKNHDQEFLKQLEKVGKLNEKIRENTVKYEELKKKRSDDYVINKLSDELSKAGAVIDQTVVSEKSSVVGKLLKEILLPKEALISAIKRGDEVIIPDGNTEFLTGDLVTVFGKENDVQKVIKRLSSS